ncbi:MAG TPA: glycosyltransferase family 39 protein [Thermoanaerobaculia bacterium]|nr:glycosyltransferase family 39 protein [Thermoanaerobaculia bacterium]
MRTAAGEGRVLAGLALTLVVVAFALRLWYASPHLDGSRWFDELYSFRNVGAVLVEGGTRPANAFYPSLSYWPQTVALATSGWLSKVTGIEGLAVRGETADGWTPTAYAISRGLSALFGALSIGVLFLLGRRLFDARVGLLAAALLAALEPHLFASAIFKPDVLVVLLVLITFGWGLDAVEKGGWGRWTLAGVGVGLAVCAKYTGVGVAFALVAGALWGRGWRQRRAWAQLVVAGLASALTFVLLNPYLFVVLRYIPRLFNIAEGKAEALASSPAVVARRELEFLWFQHRPVVFVLALVGLVAFAARAWGRERFFALAVPDRLPPRAAAMVLAYVLGYSALYAAAGGVFRGQNYIPVAAFTSLGAAWVALRLWEAVAGRWRPLASPPARALAWALALAVLTAIPLRATWQEAVPTTTMRVERVLADGLPELEWRLLHFERGEDPMRPKQRANPMTAIPVDRLSAVPPVDLARGDAAVFFLANRRGPDADLYGRLESAAGVARTELRPGLLAARGPAMAVLLHPWRALGAPLPLTAEPVGEAGRRFRALLPTPPAGAELASIALWLPIERGRRRPDWLWVGEQKLPLFETHNRGRRSRFLTPRCELAAGEWLELGFEEGTVLAGPPEVELRWWRSP